MDLVHFYKSIIDLIVAQAGSAALLHVHVGMAIYLAVLTAAPPGRGAIVALQVVLAAELGNETMDWLAAGARWTWGDTLSDFALTMLWPAAITAVGAWRRRRLRRAIATATPSRTGAVSSTASRRAPIAST